MMPRISLGIEGSVLQEEHSKLWSRNRSEKEQEFQSTLSLKSLYKNSRVDLLILNFGKQFGARDRKANYSRKIS